MMDRRPRLVLLALTFAGVIVWLGLPATTWAQGVAAPVPLGHAGFRPSPQRPVGWRGDNTGRFPGATPVTSWDVRTGRNVLWKAPMPDWSDSSPIVVGKKVFTCADPDLLICVDAESGKVLWQRHAVMDTLPAEKAKECLGKYKIWKDLNGRLASLSERPTGDLVQECARRRKELERDYQLGLLDYDGAGGWQVNVYAGQTSGSVATPASDGKHVYARFGQTVVCYDLEGKRRWFKRSLGWLHNYMHCSPVLAGDRLVVMQHGVKGSKATDTGDPVRLCIPMALDAATGETAWEGSSHRVPHGKKRDDVCGGTPVVVDIGGVRCVAAPRGEILRASDGKCLGFYPFKNLTSGGRMSPIALGDGVVCLGHTGCHGGPLHLYEAVRLRFAEGEERVDTGRAWIMKSKQGYAGGSGLYHDGLIYQTDVKDANRLVWVYDAADGRLVARPGITDPARHESDSKGAPYYGHVWWPSPTLGGKYIFVPRRDGAIYVVRPGREVEVVAKNTLEPMGGSPFFQGDRMYARTHKHLWCIGRRRADVGR